MADYKTPYSESSQRYVDTATTAEADNRTPFDRSKAREDKHNDDWKKHPVNINKICDRFTPGVKGHRDGVKFIFDGNDYLVITDMASGYLRIYDKTVKSYVALDGTPSPIGELTHFKILRREEM